MQITVIIIPSIFYQSFIHLIAAVHKQVGLPLVSGWSISIGGLKYSLKDLKKLASGPCAGQFLRNLTVS